MRCQTLAVALLLSCGFPAVPSAFAGVGEDMARARIDHIAKGDVPAVTADYAPDAKLHWIGGPLDGTYAGAEALSALWTKFSAAQGAQTASIAGIAEATNPKGSTVTADIAFAGKNTVKIRYVLVYRDGRLADEIWQVNPNAAY